MNTLQRAGAFVSIALVLGIVVAHSPWEGYWTISYSSLGGANYSSVGELSFLDWNTRAPLVLWFGPIRNVLVSLVVVGLLSGAWQFLFRGQAPAEKTHEHQRKQT